MSQDYFPIVEISFVQFDAIFLSLDGFDKLASVLRFLVLINLGQVIVDFRKLDAVYFEALGVATKSLALTDLDLDFR